MAERIPTAIGRVIPFYLGEWDPLANYEKLDNVMRNGNTYVALVNNTGTDPASAAATGKWQIVASKGDSGEISTVNATAYSTDSAQVAVSTSGDPSAIDLSFSFGLPKGDTGDAAAFTSIIATAASLSSGTEPTVTAEISGEPTNATMILEFGIPAAEGQGAAKVDGIPANNNREVNLTAVQYGRVQSELRADTTAQARARENINAQVAGNYQPAGNYIVDPNASTGQFLQFNNDGEWVGSSINLVPNGAVADIGKYLRKTANGMLWADVQSLPSAGAEGAPLIKYSNSDYDVTWGSFISNSEIDEIIEA